MAVDTAVQTFADLRRDLLFRLREVSSVTATDDAADRYINQALVDMHTAPGDQVPWARRRARLETHAPYSTGTVAIDVSASRTAVTGTSTAWDTAVAGMGFNNARIGGKLTFEGAQDVYEASAVGSATAITLRDRFIGEDDLSGATYSYFEDEYALATDFFQPVDARTFSVGWNIPFIGISDFHRRFPKNVITGRPAVASMLQLDYTSAGGVAPQKRIILHPVPNEIYTIPYEYVTTFLAVSTGGTAQRELVADTDEPIVPFRYRHAIVLHALYNWYRDRKNDDRAQVVKLEYIDIMRRILAESITGQDRPRIKPTSYFSRQLDHTGRRFQTGSEFDELKI